MSTYVIIYILLFIFALLERIDDQQEITGKLTKKGFYFICAAVLLFFGSLRYEVGFDYENYKSIYNTYSPGVTVSRFEPGFAAFMHICKNWFGLPYPYFLFFLTGSSILIKASFFYRYFKYPIFLLMLYFPAIFLYADFGQIRQGMAVGIFLWSIPAIKDRNVIKFFIVWFIAVSFHYSTLIFFPIYWLYKITVKRNVFLMIFMAGFLFNAFSGTIVVFALMQKILGTTGFLGSLLEYMTLYGESKNPLSYFLEINTLFAVILVLLYQKGYCYNIQNREESGFEFSGYNVYILMFLLIKFFDSIEVIGYRGAYFYKMIEGILLYYLMDKLKEKELKAFFLFFLFLYGLIRLIFIIQKQAWQFVPYQIYGEFFGL